MNHQSFAARNRLPAFSALREYRLRHRVRIQDVSTVSGMSLTKVSRIERDPRLATQSELERHRSAVDAIAYGDDEEQRGAA